MIIQTDNLQKAFNKFEALRGLNMSVPEGSVFAVIGANGAGKTTLIKVLMNLIRPTAGSATVLGVSSLALSPRERSRIGYVSENLEMPGRLTVGQYISYLRPFYATWDRQFEQAVLQQLRLPMGRRINELSHGMRLKMALACALPFRPDLLVHADEMTDLISSHELSEIEGSVTHVAYIEQGRLLFQQGMEELSARVREVRVTLNETATVRAGLPAHSLRSRAVGGTNLNPSETYR